VTDPAAERPPFREATVDLSAVRRSTAALAASARVPLVADLGADASGHGAAGVASAVRDGGAAGIVVWDPDEATAVRDAGVDVPVSLGLAAGAHDLAAMAGLGVDPLVSDAEQLAAALRAGARRIGVVIETGAGAPGIRPEELPALPDDAWLLAGLPDGGDPRHAGAAAAIERAAALAGATAGRPRIVAAGGPRPGGAPRPADAVCIGPELFGVSHARAAVPEGTVPAMTLWAPVVAVKRVAGGEGVSYGHTHRTTGPSTLVLVSLGYGDGVDRAAGNLAPVHLGGRRYRVAGRVAMDALVVDVGADPAPAVGDRAVLFGDPAAGHPTAADWAEVLATTAAEITIRVSGRVRRSHR